MIHISAIIPAYNSEKYILAALTSIVQQTYPPAEIIVVDDGSTDGTVDLVRNFSSAVKLICQQNQGPAAARNHAILSASGDAVAFLDSDDLWEPQKLEKQVALMEREGYRWTTTATVDFEDVSGRILGFPPYPAKSDVLEDLFLTRVIPHTGSFVILKSVFAEVGFFNEAYRIGEDWDLWMRIAARYPLGCVPEVLERRRIHPASLLRSEKVLDQLAHQLQIVDLAVRRSPARLEKLKNDALARIYYNHATTLCKNRGFALARQMFSKIPAQSRLYPRSLLYRLVLTLGDTPAARIFAAVAWVRKKVVT